MIHLFNRREVYCGFSSVECARIGRILKYKDIPYLIRDHNLNPVRGAYFTPAFAPDFGKPAVEYTLFVDKKDYEEAMYWLKSNEAGI